jgi:Tol biopolymer transport system component
MNTIRDLRRTLVEEVARLEPAPGLEARVLQRALPAPGRASRTSARRTLERPWLMAAMAILLTIAAVATLAAARTLHHPARTPGTRFPIVPIHQNGPILMGGDSAVTAYDPVTAARSTFTTVDGDKRVSDVAASPDGTRLAYLLGPALSGGGQLWIFEVKTRQAVRVTTCTCPKFSHVSWSPEGSRLAFVDGTQIYLIDADGSHRTQLTHLGGGEAAEQPTWSPDGTQIAFDTHNQADFGRLNQIDVINVDGSGLKVLLHDPSGAWDPAWSPDGLRIAYVLDPQIDSEGFDYQLWLMDSDGSHRHQIFESRGCCIQGWGGPAWSPDGKQLAIVAYPAPGWYLWVVNADGSAPRNFGRVMVPDRPAWQPLPTPKAGNGNS